MGGLAARARRSGLAPVPFVVVNAEDWGERQRFTIAHEIAHIVLDVSRGLDAERVAHRFAGAFLMPAEALRLEVGNYMRGAPAAVGGRGVRRVPDGSTCRTRPCSSTSNAAPTARIAPCTGIRHTRS